MDKLKEMLNKAGRQVTDDQLKKVIEIIGKPLALNTDVAEAAPIGSFDYIRQKINDAINNMDSFDPDGDGDNDKYSCYIVALFPDRVVIECGTDFYEMTYSIDADGDVTFGDPTAVEQYFTATESAAYKPKAGTKIKNPLEKELKESGIVITKAATDVDFNSNVGTISARLKEGSFNPQTGEVDVIIIEAGTNPLKKRHYPISTIKEAAGIFTGMKMYMNHQTAKEENERPERDLRDWVSTIQESQFSNGAVLGKVYIHDKQLRENIQDPVYAKNVGLSINTGGKISYGKINGEEMQIVEKINPNRSNGPGSVDWVTEAGARGRVAQPLRESASTTGDNDMTLKEATLEQLKTENPALYKQIQESAGQKSNDEKLVEANRVIEEMTKEKKMREQKDLLKKLLKESKLPEVVRERVMEDLQEKLFENEEKLKEAVRVRVEKELAYVNSLSTKGKIKVQAAAGGNVVVKENNNTTQGDDTPLKEAQATLEKRLGIA